MSNEIDEGMWINGESNIFNPMKDKMKANPYFNFENMWMEFANKKYMDLNPKMAKIFDV